MINDSLSQFDLYFPSVWIESKDRDWAFKNYLVLRQIESLFIESVAAYSFFKPMTAENYQDYIDKDHSPYEGCLNGLYAKSYVFALDGIGKLLSRLCHKLWPPPAVLPLVEKYNNQFGHLKHIRDSAIHIEDRGRGVTRTQEPINTNVLVLGSFIERRFLFTGEDGKQYEVEISDVTLNCARAIIQEIINAYSWSPSILDART